MMVLDGPFHKIYERGLLGDVTQKKRILTLAKFDIFRTASPFSRAKINSIV